MPIVKQGADASNYPLHDLRYVNTVLSMMYDKDGNYRAGFKPEEFYNAILLDSLKYGEENYVHLKYCETINVKKGMKTAKFRRWAGMTPTLRPLREGIPPMPDKHAYETMEVGNVFSFGRWSEYTDEVDNEVVSEVVSERSVQYGEVANQIKELYARKTWLCSPNELFANFKNSIADLKYGDVITIDDLRFLVGRMRRLMVKPVGGKFNYICSQEFINGLFDDPRVRMYMEIEQTTGKLFTTGEAFDLFELLFIPTLLDEFAYPDVEFPNIYDLDGEKEAARFYHVEGNTIYYIDVHQDFGTAPDKTLRQVVTGYLPDGTAIEDQPIWDIAQIDPAKIIAGNLVTTKLETSKILVSANTYTETDVDSYGNKVRKYSDTTVDISAKGTDIINWIKAGEFYPLPVHRGILFGDEAMIKINMEGVSDSPQIIIKPLGSAGVNDPLNQRQSIGFRVDGFGLAIKRPEALCVTYSVPTNAEFAALTATYVKGNPTLLHNENNGGTSANNFTEGAEGWYNGTAYQNMRVDAINDPRAVVTPEGVIVNGNETYTIGFTAFKGIFDTTKAYASGDIVVYDGNLYEFKFNSDGSVKQYPAGAWVETNVKKMTAQTLYNNLLKDAEANGKASK